MGLSFELAAKTWLLGIMFFCQEFHSKTLVLLDFVDLLETKTKCVVIRPRTPSEILDPNIKNSVAYKSTIKKLASTNRPPLMRT